jgi:hypothetical protein
VLFRSGGRKDRVYHVTQSGSVQDEGEG